MLERRGSSRSTWSASTSTPSRRRSPGTASSRGGDREHRHRRADDDPRRGQEPRARRRRGQARVLRRGLRRARGDRRRDLRLDPALARQRGVRPDRPLRRRDRRWFSTEYEDFPEHLAIAYEKVLDLSYGENPHQRAALYSEVGARSHVLSRVSKLHGRALSFNNVLDLDAARGLVADFDEPACVIVKHNNPCGVAIGDDALDAYRKAPACDPMSAFGGVIAFNRPVDGAGRGAARELRRGADRARLRATRRSRSCSRRRRSGSSPTRSGASPTRASATSAASSAAC